MRATPRATSEGTQGGFGRRPNSPRHGSRRPRRAKQAPQNRPVPHWRGSNGTISGTPSRAAGTISSIATADRWSQPFRRRRFITCCAQRWKRPASFSCSALALDFTEVECYGLRRGLRHVVGASMAVQDSKRRVALLTGVTGQDGAYLAEYLLGLGYTVHGIKRRASSFNTARIDHLYQDPHAGNVPFLLHYGDMTDSTNLIRLMQQVRPTEVYNLAAQSHVGVSFESPE